MEKERKFYEKENLYVTIPFIIPSAQGLHGVWVDKKRGKTQVKCYADKGADGLLRPVDNRINLASASYKDEELRGYINLEITLRPHVPVVVLSGEKIVYPGFIVAPENDSSEEYVECYNVPSCRIVQVAKGGFLRIRDIHIIKQMNKLYLQRFSIYEGQISSYRDVTMKELEKTSVIKHVGLIIALAQIADDEAVEPLPTKKEIRIVREIIGGNIIIENAEKIQEYSAVFRAARDKQLIATR